MASVNSASSASTTSGIYGSRNIISGLASGLDTESMIENSVSGYKAKITSLQQKQTQTQWKQDAYRSIIDKMVDLTRKYTSYTSSTNLLSSSFFSNAVTTTANGANSEFVSATGKTSSDIQISAITKLASAAKYSVEASGLNGVIPGEILASDSLSLSDKIPLSKIAGNMTISYGGNKTVDIEFSQTETYNSLDELKDAITKKLSEQKISDSSGNMIPADKVIGVELTGNTFSFVDLKNAGNTVYVQSASSNTGDILGIDTSTKPTSFTVSDPGNLVSNDSTYSDYLADKTMSFSLNGVTKKITLDAASDANDFINKLNAKLKTAFGENSIKVENQDSDPNSLKLSFKVDKGSTLSIDSSMNEILKLGKSTATSYLNTSKKLGDLIDLSALTPSKTDEKTGEAFYSFKLNDVEIGQFTKDTALESVLVAINSNTDAGVSASYSQLTNQFTFTSKDTGATGRVDFGSSELATKLFGVGGSKTGDTGFTAGNDAVFSASVNGETMNLTRSSNVVNLDGLSVTLKGTFTASSSADNISFTSKSDTDKITDAVKSFVDDFNTVMTEVREAFTTQPTKKNKRDSYLPLSDEDKKSMSQSAITSYEEKAKQGILFADTDLSSLYNQLRSIISPSGSDGADLRSIGITSTYSQGITTLKLDETALKNALESKPDMVKDAFTKTKDGGASTDGLMQKVKNAFEKYSSTSIATPGVLVQKAGTKLSSISLLKNSMQKKIDDYNTQIDSWKTKMSGKIDYYTKKFTALEQLISRMNSQSSYLSSLSGG